MIPYVQREEHQNNVRPIHRVLARHIQSTKKNMQPKILYPARLSFRMDGETRSFQDQQKLKEYVTTKPTPTRNIKGDSIKVGRPQE